MHFSKIFVPTLSLLGLIALLLLTVGFIASAPDARSPTADQPPLRQDYEVFPTEAGFTVRGQIDHREVGTEPDAATAINRAIAALDGQPGEVLLHRGRYPLTQPVELPSQTTLRGQGDGTELWITEENGERIAVRSRQADRAVVRRLAIKQQTTAADTSGIGVVFDHCGDCEASDLLILGPKKYGIWVSNNSFLCTVRNNAIADVAGSGILVSGNGPLGRGGSYVPTTLSQNNVYACGVGIECDRGLNVQILGNVVYRARQYAYYLHNSSNCCVLLGNRAFQCYGDGIYVKNTDELNINGNMLSWQQGHGIVLEGVTWGVVTGNIINDPSSPTFSGGIPMQGYTPREKYTLFQEVPEGFNADSLLRSGIRMTDRVVHTTVTSNTIYSWGVALPMDYAIYEDQQGLRNVITANTLNYCAQECISSAGQETIVANNTVLADSSYLANNRPWSENPQRPVLQVFRPEVLEKFVNDQYNPR